MATKLTKTQREVLERMDRGYEVFNSGSYYYRTGRYQPVWSEYAIRAQTVKRLESLGYIEEIMIVKKRSFCYRITDAGRAALKAGK
jgi:hypothetical protein